MSRELLIYTLRPDGTALYVPQMLAELLGLQAGVQLSPEVYHGKDIQRLIGHRLEMEKQKGTRG